MVFIKKNYNKRTLLIKKNILFSIIFKGIGMIVMFSMIPLSIKYLGSTNYGIWVTISGIIAWSNMFDFGFSHGLRNRLTEALARKKYSLGSSLISTTYIFLIFIAILIFIVLLIIINILDWDKILNLPKNYDLSILIDTLYIISIFFIFQFVLKPINSVLQAIQWPVISQLFGTLGGVSTLGCIYFLVKFNIAPQLPYYAFIIGFVPVFILFIGSIIIYNKKYTYLKPSLEKIDFKHIKAIGGLGLSFFLIQLSLLIVYSSDNLIISYLFGPEEVTKYNVVYKYFSVITIFFGVIMSPFWSAITDAYIKNEMLWIQKSIKSLLLILSGGSIIAILLFILSPWIFHWWISIDFSVSKLLVGLMAIYSVLMGLLNIFSFFSNGIGKIRVQLIAYLISAFINIPLSYFFGKVMNMGSSGVILSTIICVLFINIVLIIQYNKIINNKAKGIWFK